MIELIIVLPILLIMVVALYSAEESTKKRLSDPADRSALPLAALAMSALLSGSGSWTIEITTQGGARHSHRVVTGLAREAIDSALSTFRRAGITEVSVRHNTSDCLSFTRLFYSLGPRGQTKSGKVAGATIRRVV